MALDADLARLVENGVKPEPPTPDEIAALDALAPGDYEIYSERLTMIAQEGKEIMTKMGISSMLHSGDSVAAIYTRRGDLVTAICGTFLHTITGQVPIKFILKYFRDNPTVGVREGDIFYCNEALYGGIHNPDQFAIMPIFYEGELIAWSVVGAHQAETGGSDPGGEIVTANTRHDEGMKLTPIKIGEHYQLKDDLLRMMENFISRAPRMQTTDVRARVAAADRIRLRMQELAAKQGAIFVKGLFRQIVQKTEEGVRERISSWNDGIYRHTIFLDTTGTEAACLRVNLAVVKKGDSIMLDFSGTSPEHEGSFQSLAPSVKAHCTVYLYQIPYWDFPVSAGMLQAINFNIPEGSILNADSEAPISCSPVTASAVFPLLAVCFSKMMFDSPQRELVCGMASANASAPMMSGFNQHGVRYTDFLGYPLNAYGLSARHDQDGVDVWGFPHGPWGKAPDVEDIENEFPLLHLYQRQMADTGGPGRWRGGVGAAVGYVVYNTPYAAFTCSQKESKIPTHTGLFGGYAETVLPGIRVENSRVLEMARHGETLPADDYALCEADGRVGRVVLEHMARGIRMVREGDIITSSTQGGGGYGDVLEREPERVIEDLKNQIISPWAAEHVYKVAFDTHTMALDVEGTQMLRNKTRAERAERGKPYDQFMAVWQSRRPCVQALKFFGEWPTARPNRDVIRI